MKHFYRAIFVLLVVLLPGLAFAGVIRPPNGSDWDLYVYGNARVIFDILNSVKLLVSPAMGSSGFKSLLLLLATIGFVVLAISAGFDPSKNFMKMFVYIFTVWFISYGTTGLTVNVVIQDQSRSPGMLGTDPIYRIDAVPALVAFPAILTSAVGKYFTTSIETYFTLPDTLKMSGGAVGQYNLFGRMMQESSQYVITSPELKRSVSQYVADCVVPAMAMGKLQGLVPTGIPSSPTEMASGTTALIKSLDLWTTLGSARNASLLTKYYPYSATDTGWTALTGGELAELLPLPPALNATYMSSGVLVSCATSYDVLTVDMKNNADLMLQQGSDAWSRAGIMVPFQTAFQTMLTESGTVGSAGQPSGFIMQTAMMNTMNGSFRQAASQTGNSAMITAAQLAQAEQSQWSAWSAGFSTFNNMMGYVFTVLQAFIFAITPLIIVALMIPGMGKAIFVNYAQILVWLTLWMPMLAIVNFLITLYGTDSVSIAVSMEGGPSMANKGIISQAVNHQMLAAQFLGGMVPMIAWGIVKGAMAFTEFINHGIGNQFAAAAGAGAATGNMSLNNMSMDNTSMNKFSTMTSSQVGFQGVQMGTNAGSLLATAAAGGSNVTANGAGVNVKQGITDSLSSGIQRSEAITSALSAMQTESLTASQLMTRASDHSQTDGKQEAAQIALANVLAAGVKSGTVTKAEASAALQQATTGQRSASGSRSDSLSGGLGFPGGGIFKAGADAKTESNAAAQQAATIANNRSTSGVTGVDTGTTLATTNSETNTATVAKALGDSHGKSTKASSDHSTALQQAVQSGLSSQTSLTKSMQASLASVKSQDFAEGVSMEQYRGMLDSIPGMRNSMDTAAHLNEQHKELTAGLAAKSSATHDNIDAQRAATKAALANLEHGVGTAHPGFGGTPTAITQAAAVAGAGSAIEAGAGKVKEAVAKQQAHNKSEAALVNEKVANSGAVSAVSGFVANVNKAQADVNEALNINQPDTPRPPGKEGGIPLGR